MKNIVIIGSTGSIGTQALDVVRRHHGQFNVAGLTANTNKTLLDAQCAEFCARGGLGGSGIRDILALPDIDIAVISVVGMVGFSAVMAAIDAKIPRIALANKESLVAGGALIMDAAAKAGVEIIPVDSEHSAIFQCLQGQDTRSVRRLILTASGGPFRTSQWHTLENVTPEQALAHPTYNMGAKISIDSATLMNKGLEVIEAMHLFDLPLQKIDYILHPQSIIHSMVEYSDGSIIAQAACPDMTLPIAYALSYPHRLAPVAPPLDLARTSRLDFAALDPAQYPCFRLALQAAAAGGLMPCVLCAANDAAVALFLAKRIKFTRIYDIIDNALNTIGNVPSPSAAEIVQTAQQVKENILC